MANERAPLVLNDGEKLTILLTRDGRDIKEISDLWGVSRVQIWRYQNAEKLKTKVISQACAILGVSESIFDRRLDADNLLRELEQMRIDIDNLNHRVHVLEAEKSGLSDAMKILNEKQPKHGNN